MPRLKKGFGEEDFIRSLWKEMKAQEKNHPALALLHERLEGDCLLIGLTGGIASGKSTVASIFCGQKIPVIDSDEIAHQAIRPPRPAYKKIVKAFGRSLLDRKRQIDRRLLGALVFADPSRRKELEAIVHPEVLKEIVKRIRSLKKKKVRLVVIDVPLLFETGLEHHMHKIILVRADRKSQIERLTTRDKISEEEACRRIESQMPMEEKEKRADFVIDNSGPLEETRRQVEEILKTL